jgi:hypothetical protein
MPPCAPSLHCRFRVRAVSAAAPCVKTNSSVARLQVVLFRSLWPVLQARAAGT